MPFLSRLRTQTPDSLALLDTVVTLVLRLILALVAVAAVVEVATTGSTDVSVAGINAPACVEVGTDGAGSITSDGGQELRELRLDRAYAADRRWDLCLADATAGQRVAATGLGLGPVVFTVGSLLMIRRLARVAGRRGLFTHVTALAAAQLGLVLLAGSLVGPFVMGALRGVVISGAIASEEWTDGLWSPDMAWTIALAGVGVLSFASVLSDGVPLQDEVDTTV